MDGEQRRAIARSIAILVGAIIVIGVLVWAVFFRNENGSQKDPGGNSPAASEQSDKKPDSPSPQKTGETKSAPSAASPGSASQNQQQLANVGPGNMAALFTVAALSGTVFHYAVHCYRKSLIR